MYVANSSVIEEHHSMIVRLATHEARAGLVQSLPGEEPRISGEVRSSFVRCLCDLPLVPVWVNRSHLAVTALHLLKGHNLKALAVLDELGFSGLVEIDAAQNAPVGAYVSDVETPAKVVLEASLPIRKAAEIFVQHDLTYAPVFEGERYLGLASATMLLHELGRSWDPLTGLSWSDALRDWGIEKLRTGHEIGIIFLDLNNFGRFNKVHGHVVGDQVLRLASEALRNRIDPHREILVRYGGDEFAVATLRHQEAARQLAVELREAIESMPIEGVDEPVRISTGVSGGKRTRERDNVHYAATLDSLINLASQACTAAKPKAEPSPAQESSDPVPMAQPRRPEPAAVTESPHVTTHRNGAGPYVLAVSADETSVESPATVMLFGNGRVVTGLHLKREGTMTEAVALAASTAMMRLYEGVKVTIDEVHLVDGPEAKRVIAVTGRVQEGESETVFAGTRAAGHDLMRSVADATVEGILKTGLANRPVATIRGTSLI